MWGHNRPAPEEPAEFSILWLRVRYGDLQLKSTTMEKEPQAPEGDKSRLGLPGEKPRKKQGAMNYLKHANRYSRPQLG
jgi:hypothetical protein